MEFLEQDLEDIISSANQEQLRAHGLDCLSYDRIYRQVQLSDYGRADIITAVQRPPVSEGYNRLIEITVYELKQQKVNISTLLQAAGYLTAVKKIVQGIADSHKLHNTEFEYSIVLIGRHIEATTNFCYLADHFPQLQMYSYRYALSGLQFDLRFGFSLSKCDLSGKAGEYAKDWRSKIAIDKLRIKRATEFQTEESADDLPF